MGELLASHVARVRVKDTDGRLKRVGTGYLVTPATVLTAAHVVAGAAPGDVEVRVDVGGPDERSLPAITVWRDDTEGTDLAAIEVAPSGSAAPDVMFGRVDRTRDAVVDCVAVGFPWWKRRTDDAGMFRESVRISGTIAALSNLEERSLEIALSHGPPTDLDPGRSPWEGASGAAVFAGGAIVGVVAEHHLAEGPLHLTVRPVEAVYQALPGGRLAGLRKLTGLPATAAQLIDITAPAALTVAAGATRFAGSTMSLGGDYSARISNFLTEYLGTTSSPRLFAGRDRELAQLSRWLSDEAAPPYLLVTAPGGRGKSALLVHWLTQVAGRDGCDVAFVPINSRFRTTLASVVFPAIAGRLAELHGTPLPPVSGGSPDEWREIIPRLLARQPPRDRLVVILDGLDEAEGWEMGPDLLPLEPPPGLRVLVSARTLAGDEGPATWLDRLGWTDPHLGAPPLYLEPLDQGGVAQLLAAADVAFGSDTERREAAAHLWRLTQGDTLLLSLYLARLSSTADDALRIGSLPAIPPGLDGYFDRWWEDQRRLWGRQTPLQEPAVRSILTLLSCARGPITRDELFALEPSVDSWTLDEVLHALDRLMTGTASRGLAFTHPELAAYFSRRLAARERASWEQRFCDWGRTERRALAEGQAGNVPAYLLQFWTSHLAAVHDRAELMAAIWDRRWYAAHIGSDPSGASFANDVRLAMSESYAAAGHADDRDTSLDRLGDVLGCALVSATLHSLSANIAPALLEALIATGGLTQAQALAAVRRNSDPADRVGGLLAMSRQAATPGEHERLMQEALQEIANIDAEWTVEEQLQAWAGEQPGPLLADALAMIRKQFTGEALVRALLAVSHVRNGQGSAIVQEAFAVAQDLPEETTSDMPSTPRARATAKVLGHADEHLAPEVTNAAVESARRIPSPDDRSKCLATIAGHVSPPLRDNLIEEAFADAQLESWEQGPAQALANLADLLPGRLLADALQAGRALSWPRGRVDVLVALAPQLPESLLGEATAAARELPGAWWRDEAMAPIAARYAQLGDVQHALSLVSSMEQQVLREKANLLIVTALAGQDPVTAATLARTMFHPWNQFLAWKDLLCAGALAEAAHQLVALIADGEVQSVLRTGYTGPARDAVTESARELIRAGQAGMALELLAALPDRDEHGQQPRAAAYTQILDLLPRDRVAEVTRLALRALELIGDEGEQVRALCGLAGHLPDPLRGELIAESVRLARRGLTVAERAHRFSAVLPSLDAEQATEVISDLIAALPGMNDEYALAPVWFTFCQYLTPASLESVAAMLADTALPERLRAWLFKQVCPLLPDEQVPEAVRAAVALSEAHPRARALAVIAPRMSPPQRAEAVSGALDAIDQLPALEAAGYSPRVNALVEIAAALDQEQLSRTVAALGSAAREAPGLRRLDEYGSALHALAVRAAELGLHSLAMELFRAAPGWARCGALAKVVPYLPTAMLAEVDEMAGEAPPVNRRALAVALGRRNADGYTTPLMWEAVYGAVTPDVWAGADDLTGALEDLAPVITPEMIKTVLDRTRKHRYPSARALSLAHLARFSPPAERLPMYTQAVAEAGAYQNYDDRGKLLGQLAPLVPASLLPRLVGDIANIPRSNYLWASPRADAFAAVAPRLLELPPEDLLTVVGETIRTSATHRRKELLMDVGALAPVIAAAGGAALAETAARAVMRATAQWP